MIEGGYLYVDKTRDIYEMVKYPKGIYFLSRPRRFGKTLLISTLKEIFEGNRELFEGLWIDDSDYEWEAHTVVRIDFSQLKVKTADKLEQGIKRILSRIAGLPGGYLQQLAVAMRGRDWERFFDVLQVFFADIPYDIQRSQEKYYQTVFYLIFKLLGLQIGAEVRTNRGRIDAVVEIDGAVFIFEFKLDGSPEQALAQIEERGYAEKYARREDVILIGVAFSTEQRGVVDWRVESPKFSENFRGY